MPRKLATAAVAVTVALLTPAGAARADDGSSTPSDEFVWPPADSTHGRWLPVPAGYYEPPTPIEACGTTVTYRFGDVRALQYRALFLKDGTEVVFYRGDATADLVRADGAIVDELPNDGPGVETYSPDQLTVTYTYTGPAVFPAFDAVERAAFHRAGLPDLAVYRGGVLSLGVRYSEDSTAETDAAARVLVNRTRGLVDGCTLFGTSSHASRH
jgi:hypothetical protein